MKHIYLFLEDSMKYRCFDQTPQEFKIIRETKIDAGEKLSAMWLKMTLELESNKKRISDFPYFCHNFPIISEQAVDALHDLIAPYVEFLPLEVANSDKKFFGVNVWTVYDTLDLPRCDYKQFHRDFNIKAYAFKDDILPEAPIFRVRETSYLRVFINQEFRDIVEKNKLTGLRFEHLMPIRMG